MPDTTDPAVGFVALVTFATDGPATQRALVDLATGGVQEWIRDVPGFVSANYHASTDGTAVVNYAQWTDEEAYRANFAADPRAAELRAALSALPGLQGPPKAVFMVPAGSVRPA